MADKDVIAVIRNSLETQSMHRMAQRIEEMTRELSIDIALGGSYIGDSAEATAQNYNRGVGFIQCLHRMAELCKEVEDELIRGKKS